MKYSRLAIARLTGGCKSVSVKCALLNAAFFVLLGAVSTNAAEAPITNCNAVSCAGSAGAYKFLAIPDIVRAGGGTDNNIATAMTWDKAKYLPEGEAVEMQKLLKDLAQNDKYRYVKALTDLAPTDSMELVGITQDLNNLISKQIAIRMNRRGINSGYSFDNQWIKTLYNESKQDENDKSYGFDGKTAGIALGTDGKISANTTAGIGYAYNKSDVDSLDRSIKVYGNTFFTYGKYQPADWYILGLVHYGYAKYREKNYIRHLAGKAKYGVQNYGARAYLGYFFGNGFLAETGLRYTRVDRRSYTDSFDQHVKTDGIDVLTGTIGLNYLTNIPYGKFIWSPRARFVATYDIVSDDSNSTVSIGDGIYNITGKRLNRLGMEVGAGLGLGYGKWEFSLEYDFGARKDYVSHTESLNVKYNF